MKAFRGDFRRPPRADGAYAAAALAVAFLGAHGVARAELPSCAEGPAAVRLQIDIDGVRSKDGLIAITIYPDDPSRFLVHHGQIGILRTPALVPAVQACAALPSPGRYAVIVYHDANADMKFNRTPLGGPAEDYGLSNDPPTFLGLPSLESVLVVIHAGDNAIHIRMRRANR